MTEYRKINDGYYWFLQYRRAFKLFGITLFYYWDYIPRPFYDKIWGQRLDCLGTEGNVSSWHENLESFIKKWPDINVYLENYRKKQKELEDYAVQWSANQKKDKGKIVEL